MAPAIIALNLLRLVLLTPMVVVATSPAATPVLTPASASGSLALLAAFSIVIAHAAFESFSIPHGFDAVCRCGGAVGLMIAELSMLVRDLPLPCYVINH